MGKATGFLEFDREDNFTESPETRIADFQEFHIPLLDEKRRQQGARCMNCGVPFCQSAIEINHMVTGCPLSASMSPSKSACCMGSILASAAFLSSTVSEQIISRNLSILPGPKNICSVRQRPMP